MYKNAISLHMSFKALLCLTLGYSKTKIYDYFEWRKAGKKEKLKKLRDKLLQVVLSARTLRKRFRACMTNVFAVWIFKIETDLIICPDGT